MSNHIPVHPIPVGTHHNEADEGQDERGVDGGIGAEDRALVDDHRLQRRQDGAAEDCHNESCRPKFGIVAQSVEGDTVDGREHQRHATAHTNEAIHAQSSLEKDDSRGEHHRQDGKDGKEFSGLKILHQVGSDKTGTDEEQHRIDVEPLRQHLCRPFVHALCHKHPRPILDDERPAHDLRPDIEELRYHSLAVILQREDTLERRKEMDVMALVAILGHLGEEDDEEHRHDDQSYN